VVLLTVVCLQDEPPIDPDNIEDHNGVQAEIVEAEDEVRLSR
jgi:hypothetical protein